MKNIIDITIPIDGSTPIYPGDPTPKVALLSSITDGDPVTASLLSLGAHVGTHVDLPAHFLRDGKTLEAYDVTRFMGQAYVIDCTSVKKLIDIDFLKNKDIPKHRHTFLKTRNSTLLESDDFSENYIYITEEAARFLLQHEPLSIGIDYYSLDSSDSEIFPAHRVCAEYDIPVFVCLNLSNVSPGSYWFAGLPLSFPILEGAPVRAILWTH